MLKFFVIVILVGFLLFKIIGLFFRVLMGGSATDRTTSGRAQNHQYQNRTKTTADGSINIDYVPKNGEEKTRSKAFKGGEYVDYEEIE